MPPARTLSLNVKRELQTARLVNLELGQNVIGNVKNNCWRALAPVNNSRAIVLFIMKDEGVYSTCGFSSAPH